ncbi:MAG: hypothetical protein IK066_05995 [Kiritimatiellae bacterium]|nr:hypothetical protein [Kiritimatiellia bacterium]
MTLRYNDRTGEFEDDSAPRTRRNRRPARRTSSAPRPPSRPSPPESSSSSSSDGDGCGCGGCLSFLLQILGVAFLFYACS